MTSIIPLGQDGLQGCYKIRSANLALCSRFPLVVRTSAVAKMLTIFQRTMLEQSAPVWVWFWSPVRMVWGPFAPLWLPFAAPVCRLALSKLSGRRIWTAFNFIFFIRMYFVAPVRLFVSSLGLLPTLLNNTMTTRNLEKLEFDLGSADRVRMEL